MWWVQESRFSAEIDLISHNVTLGSVKIQTWYFNIVQKWSLWSLTLFWQQVALLVKTVFSSDVTSEGEEYIIVWIKDGSTPMNLHRSHGGSEQKLMTLTSFTGLSTCWVACRANSPLTCRTFRNHSKHASHLPRLPLPPYRQTSWVVTGRFGVGSGSPRPRLSRDAERPSLPASPCQTKEKTLKDLR